MTRFSETEFDIEFALKLLKEKGFNCRRLSLEEALHVGRKIPLSTKLVEQYISEALKNEK